MTNKKIIRAIIKLFGLEMIIPPGSFIYHGKYMALCHIMKTELWISAGYGGSNLGHGASLALASSFSLAPKLGA